jgi:hypothetical protein
MLKTIIISNDFTGQCGSLSLEQIEALINFIKTHGVEWDGSEDRKTFEIESARIELPLDDDDPCTFVIRMAEPE